MAKEPDGVVMRVEAEPQLELHMDIVRRAAAKLNRFMLPFVFLFSGVSAGAAAAALAAAAVSCAATAIVDVTQELQCCCLPAVISSIDRANVAFAAVDMNAELGFTGASLAKRTATVFRC